MTAYGFFVGPILLTLDQVITYEGNEFPEEATPSWERLGTFDADRWIEDGTFVHFLELGAWAPPPFGENDVYRRSISEFSGQDTFFQWRVMSDVPAEDVDGSPTVVSAGGGGSAGYHTTITKSLVRFIRDNPITLVAYFDISPDVMHTYRIEITDAFNYVYYLDGEVISSGTSLGPYPTASSVLLWSARYYLHDNTARWDYVRYGILPSDASGDYDSDGDVDETDVYFFVDCLLGPDYDAAGPGCEWADMNADGVADGKDIPLFVDAMLAA